MTKAGLISTIKVVAESFEAFVPEAYRPAAEHAIDGAISIALGEYVTAAKAFALAVTELVPLEDAKEYLTAEAAKRQQLIADVAEVVKFGALS